MKTNHSTVCHSGPFFGRLRDRLHLPMMVAAVASLLLAAGCHEKYLEAISEMENDVTSLETLCKQYNENIKALAEIIEVINSHDMITGITPTDGMYGINFLNHDMIIIYDGLDGEVPLLSIKTDSSDNGSYWTIKYGDGTTSYLKDSNGNKVPANGKAPLIKTMNGYWYISYDGGVTYSKLGQAKGDDADAMFKSIDYESSPDYVIITLSSGEILKIPTYAAYKTLKSDIARMDSTVKAQKAMVQAGIDGITYIREVKEQVVSGDTVGVSVFLSNGSYFIIYDSKMSNIPIIRAVLDSDGEYYWTIQYGTTTRTWIRDENNNKVRAVCNECEDPVVGMQQDTTDNVFYWTLTVGDEPARYIEDSEGNRLAAITQASGAIFDSIDLKDQDNLIVKMKDGEEFCLPKQYSIKMTSSLSMQPSGIEVVDYLVYGDTEDLTTVNILTQDGFKVTKKTNSLLIVQAPSSFESGQSQITVIFNLSGLSYRTIVRTIDITRI